MGFEVRSRRQWAVVCTECGVVFDGRWRRSERETDKDMAYAEDYCNERANFLNDLLLLIAHNWEDYRGLT